MRFLFPFFLLSFFAFSSALPVDVTALAQGRSYEVRDISEAAPDAVIVELEKKDIAALTLLFKTLNNSATIGLAKTALQLSLTQSQVCNFVGAFIEEKGLSSILEAADESGLALDLVMLFLTHYETITGVTNIVKQYKGKATSSSSSSSSTSSSSSSGLLGGLGDLLGFGNLFNFQSASLSSSNETSNSDSDSSASSLSSLLKDFTGDSADSADSTVSTDTATASDVSGLESLLNLDDDSDTIATDAAIAATTTTPVTVATAAATVAIVDTAAATTVETAAATSTASSGLSGLDDLLNILKRDDVAQYIEQEGLINMLKREDVDEEALVNAIYARTVDENLSELQRRDLLTTIYAQIIRIIGTNSNIESIFESLSKSGLAINVVYNAIMDSDFYKFDIKLFKYIVDEKLITLSGAFGAAISSGILTGLVGDIVGNSSYTTLVINFVLGIFTGKVPVLALITALF